MRYVATLSINTEREWTAEEQYAFLQIIKGALRPEMADESEPPPGHLLSVELTLVTS